MSATVSFEEWIRYIFDHPVSADLSNAWWWDDDAPECGLQPEQAIQYITNLFENPIATLRNYSDNQIGQGLWGVVSTSCLGIADQLFIRKLAWQLRHPGIEAIYTLFQDLMLPRCRLLRTEKQSYLDSICYMWWEVICAWGDPDDPSRQEEDLTCLAVMKRILSLDSESCMESALHGLGHWEMLYPEFVHQTINDFLRARSNLSPALREYALRAIDGMVQ